MTYYRIARYHGWRRQARWLGTLCARLRPRYSEAPRVKATIGSGERAQRWRGQSAAASRSILKVVPVPWRRAR